MLVLVTYDVNVTAAGGTSRLRRVAKTCQNYGQRVQNSVFEIEVDPAQLVKLKTQLHLKSLKQQQQFWYLSLVLIAN